MKYFWIAVLTVLSIPLIVGAVMNRYRYFTAPDGQIIRVERFTQKACKLELESPSTPTSAPDTLPADFFDKLEKEVKEGKLRPSLEWTECSK